VEIMGILIGIIIGAFIQRIYIARVKGLFPIGHSWIWSKNKYYRKLHRLYCEICPRRLQCKAYKKEVTNEEYLNKKRKKK